MIGNNLWIWFLAGLIPCQFERKVEANGERMLTIAALFWSFAVSSHPNGYRHWVLRIGIPLIGRLCSKCKWLPSVVWAVITQLQKQKPPRA
jgi:hypothetical protein